MAPFESRNTYKIVSYIQPFVARVQSIVPSNGSNAIAFQESNVNNEVWVAQETDAGWYSLTTRAQPSNGTRFVLDTLPGSVKVTTQTYHLGGPYTQQWIDEPVTGHAGWVYIKNRQTNNYLQYNGDGQPLSLAPQKPGGTTQFWNLRLVAKGSDGEWLDSLFPNAKGNTQLTVNRQTPLDKSSQLVVGEGEGGHENSYSDDLNLKTELLNAQLRHQQEQLAERNRQLAAKGLPISHPNQRTVVVSQTVQDTGNPVGGDAGTVFNAPGVGSAYGNFPEGGGNPPVFGGGAPGVGGAGGNSNVGIHLNNATGLSEDDIHHASLHGKIAVLENEIRSKQNHMFEVTKVTGEHAKVELEILRKEKDMAERKLNDVVSQLKEHEKTCQTNILGDITKTAKKGFSNLVGAFGL